MHLYRSFFHLYLIDPGLEIDLTISLDDFCPKLNKTKRKETSEPILFVVAPSGIGIRCTTHKSSEVIYSFSPKVKSKNSQGENANALTKKNQVYDDAQKPPLRCAVLPAERFAAHATSYAKNKQSQHTNYLYLDYDDVTNLLSISSSTKTLAEDGTQFHPFLLENSPKNVRRSEKRNSHFKGTFSSNVFFHFSKFLLFSF